MDPLITAGIAIASIAAVRFLRRARPMGRTVADGTFVQVTSTDELDDIFTSDDGRPKVVFLDDPWCPISAAARRQMRQLDGEVRTIDVSRRSDLARQIAIRTGIRHESPQAIVVNNGVAVWDASHASISHHAITQALADISHDAASASDASVLDVAPDARAATPSTMP